MLSRSLPTSKEILQCDIEYNRLFMMHEKIAIASSHKCEIETEDEVKQLRAIKRSTNVQGLEKKWNSMAHV